MPRPCEGVRRLGRTRAAESGRGSRECALARKIPCVARSTAGWTKRRRRSLSAHAVREIRSERRGKHPQRGILGSGPARRGRLHGRLLVMTEGKVEPEDRSPSESTAGEIALLTKPGRLELGLALASLAFTLPRVARDVVFIGDSAEIVAAAAVWGVPAAPGYPLQTFLSHLAAALPVGELALRVHAVSALLHAVAVGLSANVARRLTGSVPAAVAAAAFLMFSRTFLLGSLYAEAQPLADTLFAALLWLAVRASVASEPARTRWLRWTAAVAGLAVAHHPVLWLGLPAVAVVVARPGLASLRERPRRALAIVAAFVAALAFSLLLLLLAARRHTPIDTGNVHDLASLSKLLFRADAGGPFGDPGLRTTLASGERVGAMMLFLGASVGAPGVVMGVVGLLALLRSHRSVSVALNLAFMLLGPIYAILLGQSIAGEALATAFERSFSVVHVPVAIAAAAGSLNVANRFARFVARKVELPASVHAVLVLLPALSLLPGAWPVSLASDRFGAAFARDLTRNAPEGALVLVSSEPSTSAAEYACAVRGACQSIVVLSVDRLERPWAREQALERHPELELPADFSVGKTHELVALALPRRRVFAVPGLLFRDRQLARRFSFLPFGAFVEVHPSRAAAEKSRPVALDLAREIAAGRACEGCLMDPRTVHRPSPHVELLLGYSVLLENAARLSAASGLRVESQLLFERTRAFDDAIGLGLVRVSDGAAE